MTTPPEMYSEKQDHSLDVGAIAAGIAAVQGTDGEIPWCAGHKTDPWDMVEAAMGLSIGGYPAAAERAYRWLIRCQNPDGSWYGELQTCLYPDWWFTSCAARFCRRLLCL